MILRLNGRQAVLACGLGLLLPVLARAEDPVDTLEEVRIETARTADTLQLDKTNDTGSRLGISARDLPASLTTITHDAIELRGARTINEAIYAAVGMTSALGSGSIPNYSTRGFTGNDITLMHDGIRQNTASQEARPMDAFIYDRVEVLKGPASLMYGEGAVGGAINYVSKAPTTTPTAEAMVSGGSWNTYRAGLGVGGPLLDTLSGRVDVSENDTDGYVDRNHSRYHAAAGSLAWHPLADTKVSFYESYFKDFTQNYYGTPLVYDAVINATTGKRSVAKATAATDRLVNAHLVPDTRDLNYNNADNFVNAENSYSRLILEQKLGSQWSLRNEAYFTTQHLNWRNTENYTWNPATQLVDRSSFLLIWRQDQQLGNRLDLMLDAPIADRHNRLVVGVWVDNNHQGRNSGQTGYPTSPLPASVPLLGFDPGVGPVASAQKTVEIVTKTTATYLEDLFEPIDSLKLIGGVRYDHIDVERVSYIGAAPFTKTYNPVTGRFGAVYDLSQSLNVYASFTRAAQPVSQLVSLTASQADFALQTARQYEIGSKASFLDNTGNVTLALFDIAKQHILTSTQVDGVIYNSQIGEQVSQGAELALALSPNPAWRLDANFAWTWKTKFSDFFENTSVGLLSRSGNTAPNVPKVVAGLFLNRDIGAWSINTGLRYVGRQQANNGNYIQLPSYATWDAGVSYQWQRLTITARGRNLADKIYAEQAAGSGLMMRLGEPRSGELSLNYRF